MHCHLEHSSDTRHLIDYVDRAIADGLDDEDLASGLSSCAALVEFGHIVTAIDAGVALRQRGWHGPLPMELSEVLSCWRGTIRAQH